MLGSLFKRLKEVLAARWSMWGQRSQLILFLLLGTLSSLSHYFLCRSLSGKPIAVGGVRFGRGIFISDQALVSAGNNALSQLVKWSFAAAIATSFSQLFWYRLEPFSLHRFGRDIAYRPFRMSTSKESSDEEPSPLARLDAPIMAVAAGNPFLPSSIKVWTLSAPLGVLAMAMASMILLSTFVPGSIRIVDSDEYGVPSWCKIYVPDVGAADIADRDDRFGPLPPRSRSASPPTQPDAFDKGSQHASPEDGVFMTPTGPWEDETWEHYTKRDEMRVSHRNSPSWNLNSFTGDPTTSVVHDVFLLRNHRQFPSPCGLCQYNVTFLGAELKCVETKPEVDVLNVTRTVVPVYRATPGSEYIGGGGLKLHYRPYAWNESFPSTEAIRAIHCEAYASTYHAHVRHSSSSRVFIDSIDTGPQITQDTDDPAFYQLHALVDRFFLELMGSIAYQRDSACSIIIESGREALRYLSTRMVCTHRSDGSGDGSGEPDSPRMEDIFSGMMNLLSLSLLSGQFRPKGETYFAPVVKKCYTTQLVYQCNAGRLWGIYGAGWGVTAVCVVLGFVCVEKNGRERDMEFSTLVKGLRQGT